MPTLDQKYQRHLPIEQQLEYYNHFMNKESMGYLLGQHLDWQPNELIKYALEDCGFTKDEIEKMVTPTPITNEDKK